MLDKTYRPEEVERRQYARWEEAGAFACGQRKDARPYTIVIPPPNVTGSLHMGHALNNTIQDILIRFERMRGRDVLWQPGCDHAGIATQMVIERQLEAEGLSRRELGREAFVARIWEWKEQSGGTITEQLRRLGASCDWSRERFTMDEGLSHAVRKVFVDLYKQDLIYRDKRLVNWDTKLKTAISDLEVEQRDESGFLWHFKYPIEDTENKHIVVATTRPETMLGDTAVAVHPEDDRYRDLVGKNAILPIVGRRMPIIADEHADPEQGSGAVKITPAHDFNDFDVGKRHDLEVINIFDANADLNENVPTAYQGLGRFEARDKVVAEMEGLGLVEKIEPHQHTLPYGDRSQTVIEPWLTDQWYVDAKVLAKPAIEAVERGEIVFVPRQWENTYYAWMRDIQPWCISRQLWWGHQIPAWYAPDGRVFVEMNEEAVKDAAKAFYGHDVDLVQDEDVLDTWFSSALWPFSTLGWPEETPEVNRYYPTDALVTGFDIIFFWVARMMMMGLHFLTDRPFHTVYIHALVRDEQGRKMSKSLNNIIDPLELIDRYGADGLRFTLAAMAAQGRDVKLAESRVEGYRNFATKLWNAARFCEINGCWPKPDFDPGSCRLTLNRWIVGELAKAAEQVTLAIKAYKFNEAANAAYHFTWGTFCDWYLEFIKPTLRDGDELEREETRATAAWVLDQILHLLHPFMPFVTEELWERLSDRRDTMLALSRWPACADIPVDSEAGEEVNWTIRLIEGVRSVRAEMNVPAGSKIEMRVNGANPESKRRLAAHQGTIATLARIDEFKLDAGIPAGSAQIVLDEATIVLPLAGVIDVDQEQARLAREGDKMDSEIGKIQKKLANKQFVAKAPGHVIEAQRERLVEAEARRAKLAEALERLSG
jgi:valyl-tRNA synthetase